MQRLLRCRCYYGEKFKNLTNVQYELPTVPESKTLNCKKGGFDSKGYGSTLSGECTDEDNYCVMASCAKGHDLTPDSGDQFSAARFNAGRSVPAIERL
uniref:P-type domain-containing protein n=1 Tax=Globodera pallida TaxID=36090 RepID=A0A183C5P1_GLOPA